MGAWMGVTKTEKKGTYCVGCGRQAGAHAVCPEDISFELRARQKTQAKNSPVDVTPDLVWS